MRCVIFRSGWPAAFAVAAETMAVAPIADAAAAVAAASSAMRLRLEFEVVCIGFLPVGHGRLDRAARREGRGAGGGPTTGRDPAFSRPPDEAHISTGSDTRARSPGGGLGCATIQRW